jgi:serine protease Do
MVFQHFPRRGGAFLGALLIVVASVGQAAAQASGAAATAPEPSATQSQNLPSAPPSTPPPPILPAPELPSPNPVVKLPPKGEPAQPALGQAAPVPGTGIPLTASGTPFSFADLAAGLLDSVVYISTAERVAAPAAPTRPDGKKTPGDDFFDELFDHDQKGGDQPEMVQSLGSGFIIDASGLIVTNNHVIADSDEITANLADGRKYKASVVGVDEKTDLALLKLVSPPALKAVKFGRSEALRVGDWVLAIGNPFGFGGTVTAGIVSALDRDIKSGPYDHYIQTDASINRGNSGGPLFNISGEVVGINTAIMSPSGGSIGIGFAVPSEIAVPVIEQLRQFGQVKRGWIGVQIQEVTDDFAASIGLERAAGALIAGVNAGGPAEKAGLKPGDVVLSFNGKPVHNMRSLPQLVADTSPGKTVDLGVIRDKKSITLPIEIGVLQEKKVAAAASSSSSDPGSSAGAEDATEPDAAPVDDVAAMFGLKLGPITDDARKTYSIDSGVKGVLVASVAPGSEADEKRVRAGDVIVQVSQKPVSAPQDVASRVQELKSEGRSSVLLLVSSGDSKLRFVSLRLDDNQ